MLISVDRGIRNYQDRLRLFVDLFGLFLGWNLFVYFLVGGELSFDFY